MSVPLLVDPSGRPITSDPVSPAADPCEKCGATPDARTLITALGGYWRVVCSCGLEIKSGRGEPPCIGDL